MSGRTVQSQNTIVEISAGPIALTVADSGTTYLITSAAAVIAFTIPTPVNNFGVRYTFINASNVALVGLVSVTSNGANIVGHCLNGAATTQTINTDLRMNTKRTSVRFSVASTAGDYIDLVSNGTNWLARCFGNVTASIVGT